MKSYSWNAKDYEQHSEVQLGWARELIAKLQLSGSERLLDLGCGDGKISAEIAKLISRGEVVGVDSSEAMVERAAGRHDAAHHPNLSFSRMDARKLSFDEYFDVVFSNAALHWVKNHQPVLDGIYRSLKPGGRILLQMGGRGNAASVLEVFDDIQTESAWQRYFEDFEFPYGFLSSDEYHTMLLASGFAVERVELIPKDMVHRSVSDFQGWIRTTWLPYTERLPEAQRDIFIADISSRYLGKVPPDQQGYIHVGMVRLEVAAGKTG